MKPSCFLRAAPWWLLVLPGLGFSHLGPPDNFWAAALAVGERHHQQQQAVSKTRGNHGRSGVDTTAKVVTHEAAESHHDAEHAKWSCFLASRPGAAVDAGGLEDGLDSGEAYVCDTTKGRWSQAWQMTSQKTWQVLNFSRAFETTPKALSLNFTLVQDSDGASQRCLMSIPNTGPKESWYHAWCEGSDNAGFGTSLNRNSTSGTSGTRGTSSKSTGGNNNGESIDGVIGDGVFTISWGYINGSADGAVMTVCNPATGTDAWFGFDHVNTQQNFPSSPKEPVYDTGCS
ncbi:hypothetical protein B0T26DRAFT_672783 [Lasiosphaeria miniovina]|uniref:Uncharacterized protein n=1 Tax=Lasiosphaeria miniovina TaxID=1954250 RepID=A0AA40B608_9PEZI|nr:uncharacterized protein B0T26DRAFT_672783 [Lasiosphaeria miniovina]KAK0728214.1 hypothetical protein B0T26DRAFT_672783 [Lasiosphaeria miniovina]